MTSHAARRALRPLRIAPIVLLLAATVAATPAAQSAPPSRTGRLLSMTVHGAGLEGNLLGDPADQRVDVYLPPSYDLEPARRYPVVYMLHGFLGRPDDFTRPTFQRMTVQGAMDTLVREGRVGEMIIVVPNGRNRYGGGFYTNSVVGGRWEDFIVADVVSFVDRTYRTLASPESRGIAGHSMGGYGAIMLGMTHPELFGAVYAMSPCCLGWANEFSADSPAMVRAARATSVDELYALARGGDAWPLAVYSAAAAFSPHPGRPPFLADLPVRLRDGRAVRDDSVAARWEAMQPLRLAARYADNLRRLRGLAVDVGFGDDFPHIPPTVRALSQTLAELQVPHEYETYVGDHRNRLGARMSTRILPFFGRTLAFR
jgi:S-formylglutathione hydrolase